MPSNNLIKASEKIIFNFKKIKLSGKKFIVILIAILLLGVPGFWIYQSYFSTTKIEVKALEGSVKLDTKEGLKNLSKLEKSEIKLGDKITVGSKSTAIITLNNGESYVLEAHKQFVFSRIEKDVRGSSFYFTDLEKGKEIVVNASSGITRNSAAILSNIKLAPATSGQVLGTSETMISDSDKYQKFEEISKCIEGGRNSEDYIISLEKCLEINGLETLNDLN